VANLKEKNKLLRQNNKRLPQKVISLKDIIFKLSAKNLISDSAACNLKVDIINYNMCTHLIELDKFKLPM